MCFLSVVQGDNRACTWSLGLQWSCLPTPSNESFLLSPLLSGASNCTWPFPSPPYPATSAIQNPGWPPAHILPSLSSSAGAGSRRVPARHTHWKTSQSRAWQPLSSLRAGSTRALSVGDPAGTGLSSPPIQVSVPIHTEVATPLRVHSLPGIGAQNQERGDEIFCPRK